MYSVNILSDVFGSKIESILVYNGAIKIINTNFIFCNVTRISLCFKLEKTIQKILNSNGIKT